MTPEPGEGLRIQGVDCGEEGEDNGVGLVPVEPVDVAEVEMGGEDEEGEEYRRFPVRSGEGGTE